MRNPFWLTISVLACLLLLSGHLFAGELMQGLEKDMADVIARSKPFVVRITTETGMPDMGAMEGLEDFFPLGRRSGSGFIVEPEGYILTTENVIRGARRIVVTLHDERQYEARVVGVDRGCDVALLKIDAEKLKCARIGNSDKTVPGSWAICIGHPFGLTETATLGIVSGKGRSGLGISNYENFIQLDAAINPGDSGGPVVNSRGEVVGVMAAVLSDDWPFGARAIKGSGESSPSRRTRSISFAIPINMAMDVARKLKNGGAVKRAWLGVHITPVTYETAITLGFTRPEGAVIVRVIEESPALKAGMVKGDVIVSYGGHKLRDARYLPYLVSCSPVGKAVEIDIIRGGDRVTVKPVLESSPPEIVKDAE